MLEGHWQFGSTTLYNLPEVKREGLLQLDRSKLHSAPADSQKQ
jgi:hypothetical protein